MTSKILKQINKITKLFSQAATEKKNLINRRFPSQASCLHENKRRYPVAWIVLMLPFLQPVGRRMHPMKFATTLMYIKAVQPAGDVLT